MESIGIKNVDITSGFWKQRQDLNKDVTVYSVMNRFKDTGRFNAFKFGWKKGEPYVPHYFWESDIAKWIEGVAYIIEKNPNEELEREVSSLIDLIEKNQGADGYFNIYFTLVEPEQRFKLRGYHELYCAGHLIEASVTYYEITGKDKFLKLMCKYADYILRVFMEEQSADFVTPGHPEIELALFRLYKCTKEKKYLDLAKFFLSKRGNNDKDKDGSAWNCGNKRYDQSHLPVREQFTAEGHSVRACYLYCAMADIAMETNDEKLKYACKRIFDDIVNKKLYITGGIGASSIGEAFTIDYYLPNKRAYAETCASIALIMFAQRMFNMEHDSKYTDIVEKVIYNGMLSGVSLDGKSFFYENPLEINPDDREKDVSIYENFREHIPINQRVEVFECSCCPPNIVRTIASINNYIYSLDGGVLYINQYIGSKLNKDGISAEIITDYPNGKTVKINACKTDTVAVRIPSWCGKFKINSEYVLKDGYAYIENKSQEIIIEFEIEPVLIQANGKVADCANKVALTRGPVVYCMEGVDNGKNLKQISVCTTLNAKYYYDEKNKFYRISVDGFRAENNDERLYMPLKNSLKKTRVEFIPYYAFANRGVSEMITWCYYHA